MQKNHIGGIHIAKKVALCIFLVFATLSALPESTFGATSSVFQVIQKRVTISMKNATLETILAEINRQAGLDYGFQSNGSIDKNRRFTLEVTDVTVEEALKILLKDSPYDYVLEKNRIMIVMREKKPVELITVTGRVVDEKGNPIPGATVLIQGTTQGVATDVDGNYMINMQPTDALRVSFVGYKTEVIELKGKKKINIRLNPTAENIEEVTVVAFGEQKKESVVSAITTVDARTLKSSSSDLTTQFAGKIAGMIGWQTGGLPGALTEDEMNTKFYIRGITSFQTNANIDPLILIDGVESSKLDLSRMVPEDIETFSVMKDASATAMYGARGANGVILITTKKGEEGNVYTSVRYEAVMSRPTREIEVVDPVTYMKMYNRALLARDPSATPQYSVERIDRTGSDLYPSWLYPANDWYDILFKDYSINHRAGLNIRGGSRVVQYYASVNYTRDEGMLKTDRLNQFKVNIENNTFSFRTNLNIDLSAGIRLNINTSANFDKYRGPKADVSQAYYMAFNVSPVDFAATYPADDTYNWPHIRFGATNAAPDANPYMEIHKGYNDRRRYSAVTRAEYIHNLSPILKGLEMRASVSLNYVGYYYNVYNTKPYKYNIKNYNFETGKHQLLAISPDGSSRTLNHETKGSSQTSQLSYELRGLHVAAWGEHQTSLTVVFSGQETTASEVSSILNGIPQRNLGLAMRGSYGFRDKYFLEASFGYNGSERFAKKHRFGFFPAVGGAWIASKEPFLANNTAHWLSYLKFRLSWGEVGNDGIISNPRFVHLPVVSTISVAHPGTATNATVERAVIESYPNDKITWEIAEQVNLGVETKFFNGIVELNADIYQEIRHNIIDKRYTMPETTGLEELQIGNVGKTRSRGVDLSGKIQHAFSPDFWMILNGTFTYNKAIYLEIEQATNTPEWQRKKGKEISQQIGYIAEGLFRGQAEIDNSPSQGGTGMTMPGDIRYRDLNGDGKIDVNDAAYIGYPTTPRVIYGFSGSFQYKNVEFNFAFQGSGKRAFFMDPMQIGPFVNNRSMLKAIYDDHWSEDNMKERPFWPRLSTQAINMHNPQEGEYSNPGNPRYSTYFMRKCSFLRCTAIEVGYNLPKNVLDKLKMKNVKFYARVNNPFLITNFKVWDAELGSSGFNYPIQRTWSAGLNVSF